MIPTVFTGNLTISREFNVFRLAILLPLSKVKVLRSTAGVHNIRTSRLGGAIEEPSSFNIRCRAVRADQKQLSFAYLPEEFARGNWRERTHSRRQQPSERLGPSRNGSAAAGQVFP